MGWSFFAFARAVRDAQLPSSHKHLLLSLALRTDPTGCCFPGQDLLSQDTGMSVRHVGRVLRDLAAGPWIRVQKRVGMATNYELITPDTMSGDPGHHVTPDTMSPLTPCPGTPDTMSGRPRTPCPDTPDTMSYYLPIDLPSDLPTDQPSDAPPVAAPEPKSPKRPRRGTRLPADWVLPKGWGVWAVEHGATSDEARRWADKFRDYWIAKSGQAASKVDWEATWRNWVRTELERAGRDTAPAPKQPYRRPPGPEPRSRRLEAAEQAPAATGPVLSLADTREQAQAAMARLGGAMSLPAKLAARTSISAPPKGPVPVCELCGLGHRTEDHQWLQEEASR